jgi:uncharacterized membrane protein
MQWTSWANLFLSFWLLVSPTSLGYAGAPLARTDVLCGILGGAISISDLLTPRLWKKWTICFLGVVLLFLPLILWTRSAAGYANATWIGLLFIVCSVAIPKKSSPISEIPKGWSYNPSEWHHRIPVIILALLGFFIARIMAAYQLGHIPSAWDPFFGDGTSRVLTSEVARAFPISDAGLGAVTYLLEGLSGLVGDKRRWRTMPWMVFLFFILVVPAGVVSIILIMLQPVVVGAWCTLCLITALLTLISIPPAVDEIFASSQFLIQCHREKKSLWDTFWKGNHVPAELMKEREISHKPLSGVDLRWNLGASALLGIWIVLTPVFFEMSKNSANSNYILGALITTFAVLASAEPIRAVRFLNILFAAGIFLTAILFDGIQSASTWNNILIGLLLIPLSFPKGKIREHYGGWDRYII